VYNLRYHIASLVAVFLALAVGLLLGTIVVERGVLKTQVTSTVQGLQREFDQISANSAALKKQNDSLSAFATQAAPQLVASTLTSRTVLVIASPETADTVTRVNEGVKAAGGTTAIAMFNDAGLSLGDSAVAAAAGKALGVPVGSVDETGVITALVREWSPPEDGGPLTKALVASGGLKVTGLSRNTMVSGVVVTGTFNGTPDPAAFRLARAFADSTRAAVGVETTKRSDGTAAAAKAAGLSGVDDIDAPLGEVSLVWVLSGRASGLFGLGDGVDGPFPMPLFPVP
jgi:hypothetical protein